MTKFEKPGPKAKKAKILNRTPRIHDMPKPTIDDSCAVGWCKDNTTLRWCHVEDDIIKFLGGGGIMGGKVNDNLTALLCSSHDEIFSRKPPKDAPEIEKLTHSLVWACLIIKSRLLRK